MRGCAVISQLSKKRVCTRSLSLADDAKQEKNIIQNVVFRNLHHPAAGPPCSASRPCGRNWTSRARRPPGSIDDDLLLQRCAAARWAGRLTLLDASDRAACRRINFTSRLLTTMAAEGLTGRLETLQAHTGIPLRRGYQTGPTLLATGYLADRQRRGCGLPMPKAPSSCAPRAHSSRLQRSTSSGLGRM